MKWPETTVPSPDGPRRAVAPDVVSASRATDVPAFRAERFMRRLRAGHCLWVNPFNAGQRQIVSFERCRAFVFWSKNPRPLMPFLREIEDGGRTFYFQYTLNDYGAEGLEPGVPSLDERVGTFQELSERLGRHRVIWRFDPILLGGSLTPERVLDRIEALAERLAPYTDRLVFSFLDMYRKTRRGLEKVDPRLRAPTLEEMRTVAAGLARIRDASCAGRLALSTCAEEIDLEAFGIGHGSCVDPRLLARLCPDLAGRFDRRRAPSAAGSRAWLPGVAAPSAAPHAVRTVRDSGQRRLCGCAPSRDIGSYGTCRHGCRYCYAGFQSGAGAAGRRDDDERV